MSYLTSAEWREALVRFRWADATPLSWSDVSKTQLERARHDGGIRHGGAAYLYIPETDELLRLDVFKWLTERRKA